MRGDLFILRGLPGSGKSTVAELISEKGKYPVCCADDYFSRDGEYKFLASKLPDAHEWCRNYAIEQMQLGVPKVIIANTATREREFAFYAELAENYGYRVHYLIVENRHGNENIHGVPNETLEKMKERFEVQL